MQTGQQQFLFPIGTAASGVGVDGNGNTLIYTLSSGGGGGGGSAGVSTFNGRSGVVVPASGDYSFSQINGQLNLTNQVVGILPTGNIALALSMIPAGASGQYVFTDGVTTRFGTAVASFNGRVGQVTPNSGDYSFTNIAGLLDVTKQIIGVLPTGNIPAMVMSFNSRTGSVVPTSGDYTFTQLGGQIGLPTQSIGILPTGNLPGQLPSWSNKTLPTGLVVGDTDPFTLYNKTIVGAILQWPQGAIPNSSEIQILYTSSGTLSYINQSLTCSGYIKLTPQEWKFKGFDNIVAGNGGDITVEPGAKNGPNNDGRFKVRQPGATAGTHEVQLYNDGTNSYIFSPSNTIDISATASPTTYNIQARTAGDVYFSNGAFYAGMNSFSMGNAQMFGCGSTATPGSVTDVAFYRLGPAVWGISNGTSNGTAPNGSGWIQNSAGISRVSSNQSINNATLSGVLGLSLNIQPRKYAGYVTIKCNNTIDTDGILIDFNGGTAPVSGLWVGMGTIVSSGNTLLSAISTSASGVLNYSKITGETILQLPVSFVAYSGGTFQPRVAVNSHSTGVLTIETGSWIELEDIP